MASIVGAVRAEVVEATRIVPASFPEALKASRCGSCHRQHFDDWSRSFHARSLTSDNFSRAFSQYLDSLDSDARGNAQSSMSCLVCHAPLLKYAGSEVILHTRDSITARQIEKLDGFEVGCVACHIAGEPSFRESLAASADEPLHPFRVSRTHKNASFCAGCHSWDRATIPCSNVYDDWKKSRAAEEGTTCQACHMPEQTKIAAASGPQRKVHSHIFPGGRSPAMLKQAVELRLAAFFRRDRLEVTATVRNLTPHRVPDG